MQLAYSRVSRRVLLGAAVLGVVCLAPARPTEAARPAPTLRGAYVGTVHTAGSKDGLALSFGSSQGPVSAEGVVLNTAALTVKSHIDGTTHVYQTNVTVTRQGKSYLVDGSSSAGSESFEIHLKGKLNGSGTSFSGHAQFQGSYAIGNTTYQTSGKGGFKAKQQQ